MKKLIVGQSGGPTSVINGSLAGIYYEAKKCGFDKKETATTKKVVNNDNKTTTSTTTTAKATTKKKK